MYYKRELEDILPSYTKFPVVAILGPRQSGKTTLARHYFKNYTYLSFEDPAIREYATSDPRGFLLEHENKHGIILDEFQYVPHILSYIQLEVDEKDRPGYFVLSGSQNYLMNPAITQSLAGRVGILTLLPLSIQELIANKLADERPPHTMLKGGYPRIYVQDIEPAIFYPSYINTYVERDVRQLVNVHELNTFTKFLALCAGRIGQLLNLSDIAMHCGISAPTAKSWLSILEASYLVFRLQPYFVNFNKRITKTPKLYFYDTGLACNLLRITSEQALAMSSFRGSIFENLIVTDLYKQFYNRGRRPSLYFWRDKNGLIEVDCLVEKALKLVPIEIKSSETISPTFFKGITKWNEISQTDPTDNYIVYAGKDTQNRTNGHIIGWKKSGILMAKID